MKITVVDLETDGVDPRTCQVLEVGIAVADLEAGTSELAFESLVCPPHFGWEDCWFMQHAFLDRKDILEAPRFEEIKPKLEELMLVNPVTAYNLAFDLRIIYRHGISVPKQWPCLMQSAKPILRLPPYRGDWKYPKFSESWHYFFRTTPLEDAHRAGPDAVNEGKLLIQMAKMGHFAKETARWTGAAYGAKGRR